MSRGSIDPGGLLLYAEFLMTGFRSAMLVFAVVAGMQQSRVPAPTVGRDVAASNTVDTPHVTINTSVKAGTALGPRVSLLIDVTPKPRMHVYSPLQKDYIPVSIALKPDSAYRVHEPTFPKPEKYFFEPLKETQLVYSKPFRIVQDVTLASRPGASMTIEGTFRYQACDDAICYLPKTVPVSWTITLRDVEKQPNDLNR
jgi:DsbC/DsbD-like thiol-disulfide interchange protein